MILIALMCARIPRSPDNFKRAIKYHTFQTSFYSGFESVANPWGSPNIKGVGVPVGNFDKP